MKKYFLLLFVLLLLPQLGGTAWQDPGCDPSVSGPGCATITAPINISTDAQIKEGALTIQNTLTADDLEVVNTATITDLTISNSIILPGDSITDAMVEDVFVLNTGDDMTGSLDVLSVNDIGVQGITNSADTLHAGVYGSSQNTWGVYGSSDNRYGVIGCFTGNSNCGYLGGSNYAGYFNGALSVSPPNPFVLLPDQQSVTIKGNLEIENHPSPFRHKGITLYDELDAPHCLRVDSSNSIIVSVGVCP